MKVFFTCSALVQLLKIIEIKVTKKNHDEMKRNEMKRIKNWNAQTPAPTCMEKRRGLETRTKKIRSWILILISAHDTENSNESDPISICTVTGQKLFILWFTSEPITGHLCSLPVWIGTRRNHAFTMLSRRTLIWYTMGKDENDGGTGGNAPGTLTSRKPGGSRSSASWKGNQRSFSFKESEGLAAFAIWL